MAKVKELTHLRVDLAIAEGDTRIYEQAQMLVLQRGYEGETVKLLINMSKEPQTIALETDKKINILCKNHASACGKDESPSELIVEKTGFIVIKEK